MTAVRPLVARLVGACALVAGLTAIALAPASPAGATERLAAAVASARTALRGDHARPGDLEGGPAAFGRRMDIAARHWATGPTQVAGRPQVSDPPQAPLAATTFIVDSTADDPLAAPTGKTCEATNAKCTLRAAVGAADNLARAVTIKLAAADYVLSNAAETLTITDPAAVTITGISAAKTSVTVKSGDAFGVFAVTETGKRGAVLFLQGVTLSGGSAPSGGGLDIADSPSVAVVSDVVIKSNKATSGGDTSDGGGIFDAGQLFLTGSTVEHNSASGGGGGVDVNDGTAVITDTAITANNAGEAGGGLVVAGGAASVLGGSVDYDTSGSSTASGDGGGIAGEGSEIDLSGTVVDHDSVLHAGTGGGIIVIDASLEMEGGQLSRDAATSGGGGAAAVIASSALIDGVTAEFDSAGIAGGLAAAGQDGAPSSLTVMGGTFDHDANGALGAIGGQDAGAAALEVSGAAVDDNASHPTSDITCGAAICAWAAAGQVQLGLTGDTIDGNSADSSAEVASGVQVLAAAAGSASVTMQSDRLDDDTTNGGPDSAGGMLIETVSNTSTPVYSPVFATIDGSTFEHDSVGKGGSGGGLGVETDDTSDEAEATLGMSGDTFEHDTAGADGTTMSEGGGVALAALVAGSISHSAFGNDIVHGKGSVGGGLADGSIFATALDEDSFSFDRAVGFGGGAATEGSFHVAGCSFVHDTSAVAGSGLAILSGVGSVTASTFDANTSSVASGAGGAILAEEVVGTISNSTMTGNSAGSSGMGGAIAAGVSSLTLDSDTITANVAHAGAGLYTTSAGQAFALHDTIVSGNRTGGAHGSERDCGLSTGSGEVGIAASSEGGNVLGSADCVDALATMDKVSTSPKLAALAHNGGPTLTMALDAGSPAIARGVSCLPADQRGVARPATGCDAGSYEKTKA